MVIANGAGKEDRADGHDHIQRTQAMFGAW